jgi:AcrR family transcriptional regulator
VSEQIVSGSNRPPRKQQQRSIVTQKKLLDAAIEAFSENGFKGTSTRDIAERAGVHHPLITYHFKNKDQLWRAAADRIFSAFNGSLSLPKTPNEADIKSRFTSMIRAYVRYAHQNPALHKVMVQEASYPNPRIDWLIETHLRPFYETTVETIRTLQDDGVAPEGNPALLYHMIRLSAGGLLALNLELKGTSGIDIDDEETLDEIADMIVRVFLPGGSA